MRTIVYIAAMVGLLIAALPYVACGPSASYEAGIPPERGSGFLFYAEIAARELGYSARTSSERTSVNVEVPPHGSITYVNTEDAGIVVSLYPESEPESESDARIGALRVVSDEIIGVARKKANENAGF